MDESGYFSSMFSWEHIPQNKMIALMVILVIFYILIFKVITKYKPFQKIQLSCLKKCKTNKCRNITDSLREDDYFLGAELDPKECMFTGWEFSHVIFHAFIGFFYNIYVSLGLSVGFEVFEHFSWNCASGLDLGWNMAGYLIGHTIRHYTLGHNTKDQNIKKINENIY